jgi:hypothetical protein
MVIYIDDGNIWISPLSPNTNICILQAVYKTVRHWLTKNGDIPQAPYPHVDQSRLKVSNTYQSSYRNVDYFPHITR